jgi:predicted nuclease of predicted toxin-antitoxin system
MFIDLVWIRKPILAIREYAGRHGFLIVTKDVDFSDLCVLRGFRLTADH